MVRKIDQGKFLNDESPIEKENLNFEEKSPNLDVYGLDWIFI